VELDCHNWFHSMQGARQNAPELVPAVSHAGPSSRAGLEVCSLAGPACRHACYLGVLPPAHQENYHEAGASAWTCRRQVLPSSMSKYNVTRPREKQGRLNHAAPQVHSYRKQTVGTVKVAARRAPCGSSLW